MQLDGSRTDGSGDGSNGNGAGTIQAAWTRVKRRLRAELGEDVFASWFARLELEDVTAGVARLTVPTRFLKSWIESHYLDRVLNTFKAELDDVVRLDVGVRGPSSSPRPVAGLAKPAAPAGPLARYQSAGAPAPVQSTNASTSSDAAAASRAADGAAGDLSSAPLDPRLTFASFVVGRSNALAHAAGERVSRHDGEGALYNPLYVHAGVGLGKTHLLHGVGHAAREAGRRVIYLTADRFMYGFVNALKTQNALAFKERLRAIDLLILDDVQFIQGKSIQAEFGHTLNALIDAGKQVVVASDRPPTELEALDERVRSRLAGGLVVEIGTLDEGLRASILQARLAAVRVTHPGFDVAPAVAAYVAKAITANGRDLEGAVNRLLAHSTLTGAPVTVETAEAAIRDLVKNREPKRIKIEDIQKLVASRYNVSRSDILSERRTAAVVKPRQIAMYLSKVLTLRSLPEIGRRFGGRDHTTVLHAVRKIEKLIGDDPVLGDEVELLKRMLQD
ncbi:chromosomal replication initiator protein DnaA [Methylobacterium gnaphalii]|uniref:Chromosomal replication initiator protein DnaA n=1 Tax=Methylobacterium gnaphalii TaxID=1010610 RepID=A0A512JKP2_9HYPH|nr:chromosomal replication initiator protein DnaA [Methylobacterium gnaphalii]GEP10525.1 chromosomal replication initiator protein DnaA [Methylobacterium gnaphalii]GJD69247.1 Chromosomal replication initiator protein DnaA [Methylobacterium gnaphalii]GLS47911.1 chromosomal replication initiator protein DnaA [Methylobacterium gnaphalii]